MMAWRVTTMTWRITTMTRRRATTTRRKTNDYKEFQRRQPEGRG